MTDEERDMLAAELALGMLDADDEARALALERAEPAFAAEVTAWRARLAPLALAIEPVDPPGDLLSRIEAQIDREGSPAGTKVIRRHEGRWRAMGEGVAFKLLSLDKERRRRSILIRMEPGASYAGHVHDHDEEMLMLEGDLRFGDLELGAGDFHIARAGTRHPTGTTRGGCLIFLSMGF